ncbi:hypothetical protein [Pontixanthobacter sp. CEM42]|uniref:hypothetical protein n=1 Tax=Pontixanthobacter sp. CEM42 TaxID=2792077 RepID=UPI001AE05614|nr:hypothetical protein [Pontixanthobacter sp. CEM42]
MAFFRRKKTKSANPSWGSYPDSLDVDDLDDVTWIKSCQDPLVWHDAAMACLIFRGDKHGLIGWLAEQPQLDRVTAATMFLHRDNGPRILRGDVVEYIQMKPDQIIAMIKTLCERDSALSYSENGIGLGSGWEDAKQSIIAELSHHSSFPMHMLAKPIHHNTVNRPYYDIGEGELVSDNYIREHMPYMVAD